MKKTILLLIILIACQAAAYTKYDADEYYSRARGYYNENLYKNALRDVYLARRMYDNLSSRSGVSSCDLLISQIENSTTTGLRAGYLYSTASDFFFDGLKDPNIESFELTKYFARLSKEAYEEMNSDDGVMKSDQLMSRASDEILKIRNARRTQADNFYNIARTHFINKDYELALTFANNASMLYENISDQNGILKVKSLVSQIESETGGIKRNAQTTYNTAENLYAAGNITLALTYAEKAKTLYTSIGDSGGIAKSNNLVSLIKQVLEEQSENRIRLAEDYKNVAEEEFVLKHYENASDYAKRAKEIYLDFYRNAERERDKDYYMERISDVNRLHRMITDGWGVNQMGRSADSYYNQALEFYNANLFEESVTYAERAKDIYEDIENYVGIEKCDTLITTISGRISREKSADSNMTAAEIYCAASDFENSRNSLDTARSIYATLLGVNKSWWVENVTLCIENGEKKKKEAKEYFDKAFSAYQSNEFRDAKKYAETSNRIYTEINFSVGMQESASLLQKADLEVRDIESRERTTILSAVIVVLVLVIVIVSYYRRRKEFIREEARIREERGKREELDRKKWEVKEEEVTEEKVKDELRKLIEEEREKVKGGP